MKKVIIYSLPTCHFCHKAKEFFKNNNIEYTDYNIAENKEKREEMIEKSGQMGTPVIYVGDELVVGFNELKLKELLGI